MSVVVRFANFDELEKINVLRRQVNDLHVSGRPDIFRAGFCDELRDHLFTRFSEENSRIAAALHKGEICGFATVVFYTRPVSPYSLERKIYSVEEIGVDIRHRRLGIGRAIMDFLKRDALERGFERIELDMWTFNESALAFYESVGFTTYRRYMELNIKGYPTRENAHRILDESEKLNPGPWGDHSRVTAKCAEAIASSCSLDGEKAYVLGLLHDIGRRFGFSYLKHVYDGYGYMNSLGYPDAARICLSHSFPTRQLSDYIGSDDATDEQRETIVSALSKLKYDDYDRLIQLCDAISMPHGAVSPNERMDDVARRYGSYPQDKRDRILALAGYFEIKAGAALSGITENIKP